MKKVLKISWVSVLLLAATTTFAQQDAMFTHYMYNTLAVNSGYAGTRDALTITGLHRSQWVGFDGAPTTQTITLHTPIMKEEFGVGFSLVNDKIGPTNTTSFNIDLAYHMKVSEKGKLAFGLKGGGNLRQGTVNQLEVNDNSDQLFQNNVQTQFMPNFGFSMYYYSEKFYLGASAPKLLENKFKDAATATVTNQSNQQRHYFVIAGLMLKLNESVKLKPTTFLKLTEAAPAELDLTATFVIKDKFSVGGMFRSSDALGMLVGYQVTEQLGVGYSFDWSYGNTTFKYNGGSHEIMVRYDFIYRDKEKIRSPRYF